MSDGAGDVVCVGVVPRGQLVDWSENGREPSPAEWVPEAIFIDILRAAALAKLPLLPKLDLYAQTRFGAADCTRLSRQWSDLEAVLQGSAAEGAAASVGRIIQIASEGSDDLELLIEGP